MFRFSLVAAVLACVLVAGLTWSGARDETAFSDVTEPFRQWNGKLRFPSNALEPDDPDFWLNDNRYASYILDGMNEDSLFDRALPEDTRIIRLTILPSFSASLTARIEVTANEVILIYKTGNSGGWGPVTAFEETRVDLPGDALDAIVAQVEGSMICTRGYSHRLGADGSTWILEYKDPAKYCAYRDWSPEAGFFHEIFKAVHLATGMSAERVEEMLWHY